MVANSSNSSTCDKILWKTIWNTNIVTKLQIWAWQDIHHRLPCAIELKKRNITHSDLCQYCGD